MPNYRWTFTCEETLDDNTVVVTTKTLVSDSETFTSCLGLIPQLFNGAGFRVEDENFQYKGVDFYKWTYETEEAFNDSLKNDYNVSGLRSYTWPEALDGDEEYIHGVTARMDEYFPPVRTRPKPPLHTDAEASPTLHTWPAGPGGSTPQGVPEKPVQEAVEPLSSSWKFEGRWSSIIKDWTTGQSFTGHGKTPEESRLMAQEKYDIALGRSNPPCNQVDEAVGFPNLQRFYGDRDEE